MVTDGEQGAGEGQVGRARGHGEEAEGRPHVPRGEGAEVVVARLVHGSVGVLGVHDGPHDRWVVGRCAEEVELPRGPLARFVARPVVGGVPVGVERREGVELARRGRVAAHEGGQRGQVLRDRPRVLHRVALLEAGLAARLEL